MRYMLNIYDDQSAWGTPTPEEFAAMLEAYGRFDKEATERGAFVSGEALEPVSTATTVRFSGGERMVTDGPFAETKEQLGGFYLLECKDLDEAIEWAAKIPVGESGCVEVRPVMDTSG